MKPGPPKGIPHLNAEWHAKNRMPKNPTWDKRLEWHRDHAQHCACRPLPAKLREELARRDAGKR